MMNLKSIFCFLTCFLFFVAKGIAPNAGVDKDAFYTAMESNKIADIDVQLELIGKSNFVEKQAYEGALLMKKAGLMGKPKDKINLFKAGKTKLEAAIANDKNNTEFRFLRLILQEHAPKIVKYRNNLDEDSKFISTNFDKLSNTLQKLVSAYGKKSKILKTP
jgi:hypothetical protein